MRAPALCDYEGEAQLSRHPEPVGDRVHRVGQGLLISDVAVVHADRDRPALRRARQPVVDLQLALDLVLALSGAARYVGPGRSPRHARGGYG